MARDILKTLKVEHDAVRALFDEMNQTTDRGRKSRENLLERIEAALIPHSKWEETVFYPAFKERADRDGLQVHAEAVEEHRAVESTVMPDVHASPVDTPEFAGRAKERAQLDEQYESWKRSSASDAAISAAKAKTGLKGAVNAIVH